MNKRLLLWVWFTTLGIKHTTMMKLYAKIGDIEEIYNAGEEEYLSFKDIPKTDIKLLLNKNTTNAASILTKLNIIGGYAVDFDSESYPERLRRMPNPPYVLYVRGNLSLNEPSVNIGIVGTRNYTKYGEAVTKKLAFGIARYGVTVVSGMARGIDTFSHIGALKAGSKTIAVLGSGIDVVYPPENVDLMNQIMENGAVVSEYPPGSPPLSSHFPERNRIIAALSDGIIVTEAPSSSGALITADIAYEIGRKVFAVPGSVFDINSVGTNNLIKAGMNTVTHPNDILEEFSLNLKALKNDIYTHDTNISYPEINNKYSKNNNTVAASENTADKKKQISIDDEYFSSLSGEEKQIAKILIENEKLSVDELIRASELPASQVNSMLPLMEINGFIKKLAGNFYILNTENI